MWCAKETEDFFLSGIYTYISFFSLYVLHFFLFFFSFTLSCSASPSMHPRTIGRNAGTNIKFYAALLSDDLLNSLRDFYDRSYNFVFCDALLIKYHSEIEKLSLRTYQYFPNSSPTRVESRNTSDDSKNAKKGVNQLWLFLVQYEESRYFSVLRRIFRNNAHYYPTRLEKWKIS